MDVHVLTVFPQLYKPFLEHGLLSKAIERDALNITPWSLRRFASDSRGTVDDHAYGGHHGMVMKPEPYFRGVEHLRRHYGDAPVLMTRPDGRRLDNEAAKSLSERKRLIILTGRYEGVDERVHEALVEETWSIGPYITPGGDLPALVLLSAMARFLPGVVSNPVSVEQDSFESGRLAPPHYTRPADFRGLSVPDVLLSGDHQRIDEWRKQKALERTRKHRPDLLKPSGTVPPEEQPSRNH